MVSWALTQPVAKMALTRRLEQDWPSPAIMSSRKQLMWKKLKNMYSYWKYALRISLIIGSSVETEVHFDGTTCSILVSTRVAAWYGFKYWLRPTVCLVDIVPLGLSFDVNSYIRDCKYGLGKDCRWLGIWSAYGKSYRRLASGTNRIWSKRSPSLTCRIILSGSAPALMRLKMSVASSSLRFWIAWNRSRTAEELARSSNFLLWTAFSGSVYTHRRCFVWHMRHCGRPPSHWAILHQHDAA